ncbi:MAG: hypothetical protein R6T92_03025 [Desulfosalsimonadaceae bacterium]
MKIFAKQFDAFVKVVFERQSKTFKIKARAVFEELSHAFGVMRFFKDCT